jgi:nicotinate-nucleotide adenylyltransferase
MAVAARKGLGLDRMLLMPATSPPHKSPAELSDYAHRLAMVELLADPVEGVEASRFEERSDGPSYTVDMLREFGRESGAELYFILGSDSVADMQSWRDPGGILSLCTLVVFMRKRPGAVAVDELRLAGTDPAAVVVFEEPVIDVSSTEVRERIRHGEPVAGLVTAPVLSYIEKHRLYI